MQGKDESVRAYIERINQEFVQVSMTDNMKKYLLEWGHNDFTKAVDIETAASQDALLLKAQSYIH